MSPVRRCIIGYGGGLTMGCGISAAGEHWFDMPHWWYGFFAPCVVGTAFGVWMAFAREPKGDE